MNVPHYCLLLYVFLTQFICVRSLKNDSVGCVFDPSVLTLQISDVHNVSLLFSRPLHYSADIVFTYVSPNDNKEVDFQEKREVVRPLENITVSKGSREITMLLEGMNAGIISIGLNITSPEFGDVSRSFIKVTVLHSSVLDIVNTIIGWIYFVAWSISFYPQIFQNWRRKSVVGLNFDFLAYNITGFLCYSTYNVAMYFIHTVWMQYIYDHPGAVVNPVQPSDVAFALHAVFVCGVTIVQCIIYESGNQTLSRVSIVVLSAMWLFMLISLFVAVGHVITWLKLVEFYSYVKLAITLFKYIPQARMNCVRKSTIGWSIGNVLLDFTGGSLSILQMLLIAYNADDWRSVMGNPTKFGLGLFSVLFDILFILQHYCLYRSSGQSYRLIGSLSETN